MKDEAPDRIVWRTPCGRGYEPVVRHTTECMKAYGGVEVQLQALLTLALEGSELSATRPSRVITCVHCLTGWVRHIAGLAALWKDLIFLAN